MKKVRADYLTSLADSIGQKFQTDKGTDLASIFEDNEIDLHYDSFDDPFDGLIVQESGTFRVYCNTATGNTKGSVRTRFTQAHELGHYFIDEHRNALMANLMPSLGERCSRDEPFEREADLFASRLLLPSSSYRKLSKKLVPGLFGIRSVSTSLSVSFKCAAIRYLNEDSVSCCLTFRNWEGKLLWRLFSPSLWISGIRQVDLQPLKGGATASVLSVGSERTNSIEESDATARYLFKGIDGTLYDELFKEESIGLGEYGVLSLFSYSKGKLSSFADTLDRRFS